MALDLRTSLLKNKNIRKSYHSSIIFLSTHGLSLPFVRPETIERPWRQQGSDNSPYNPQAYRNEDASVVEMFKDVLPYLDKDSKILEIGCNMGRSLNYLYKKGFRNLTGVEIGPKAVESMKTEFPEMYKDSKIIVGSAPEVLKTMKTGEYDLVFCHSVLVSIHPSKNYLFREMARVSRKFVLTLENEGSYLAFPRDFKKMFEKNGMKMIMFKVLTAEGKGQFPTSYEEEHIYTNNTVRLFVHDKSG